MRAARELCSFGDYRHHRNGSHCLFGIFAFLIQEVAKIAISSFTNSNCYGTVDQGHVYGGFHALLMNLAYNIEVGNVNGSRIVLTPYSGDMNWSPEI